VIQTATRFNLIKEGAAGLELMSHHGSVSIHPSAAQTSFSELVPKGEEVDVEAYHAMRKAWDHELDPRNVSQGSYLSSSAWAIGAEKRLQSDHSMEQSVAKIFSWTHLSAAGTPSEFSFRAPILGGITTILVQFPSGEKDVFMQADDDLTAPSIGRTVSLVVRRLYAIDAEMRYGCKAIIHVNEQPN
jgi:hypothetical protein